MDIEPIIDDLLADARQDMGCPGILCAVNDDGQITTHSAGSISRVDHDKRFYIYSIIKTFTAVSILHLAERGLLGLDECLTCYLSRDEVPGGVTVRQLLNHSSGLSDYGGDAAYREGVKHHPGDPWPYEELMRVGLRDTPLFEPGGGWSYSNPGYALLNELIERVSGMGFYDFMTKHLFEAAGLGDTTPFLVPDSGGELLEGEDTLVSGDFRKRYAPGWILTGCLISTVSDLTRFYHALFTGKLIGERWLEEMKKTVDVPYPMPEPQVAAYGLGVMHSRYHPLGEAYGHGGGGPGYSTYVQCYPSLNGRPFSLALVINKSDAPTPFELADRITRCA